MDEQYFKEVIQPLLDHPLVRFVGEIADQDKDEFLGNALALLAPVNWPEPFGIALIEAMACGTPVIAFARGSVPEVVDNCQSGFIIQTTEEAISAIEKLHLLNRHACRPGEGPTLYPVACAPQSWAAASVFLLLEACLGVQVQNDSASIIFRRADLPESLPTIQIKNLHAGDGAIDIVLERAVHSVGVTVLQRLGKIDIVSIK